MPFHIRPAEPSDLPAILAIYNGVIRDTLAIWKDEPVVLAEREAWFAARRAAGHPVLVAEVDGAAAGYAATSDFRGGSGFRLVCENSVHVAPAFQRRGVARALMGALIEAARASGRTQMVAAIGLPNEPSIALHEVLGFKRVGLMPGIGVKRGQRLDLLLMQRVL